MNDSLIFCPFRFFPIFGLQRLKFFFAFLLLDPDLLKLGFLVSLDGNIIYHVDIYSDFKNRIMKLFETNDKITVPEAKEAIGLSRKFAIPLLNRIENEGLIKRLGDFRIKV